jgi:plasmid replication initiation protein
MSLQEARILRLLITQVAKEDKDLMTYTVRITELAEFLKIPKTHLYRDIKGICNSLLQRLVHIGTDNPREPWEKFQWVQLARYDGNGNLTLMLSNQIKPFVIALNERFTQYKLANILELDSWYAIRLYEVLKSDEYQRDVISEYPEYTVQELREAFGCENKYKLFGHFKARVIDIAVREINEKTDLYIRDVEYIKDSRAVVGLRFVYGYLKPPQLPGQITLDGDELT